MIFTVGLEGYNCVGKRITNQSKAAQFPAWRMVFQAAVF
jgi:hypothetical protein